MDYEITLESKPDYGEKGHNHEYCSVVLVLDGEGVYLVERNIFTYARHSLFVIPPSVLHMSGQAASRYERYIVRFPLSLLSALGTERTNLLPFFHNARHLRLNDEQSARVQTLLRQAAKDRLPERGGFGADLECHIAFVRLLLAFCGYISASRSYEASSPVMESRITPILNYIQAHIAEPFSIDDVARGLFMSKYHLCRLFKQHTGFTLGEYIIRSRLHRAQELLRAGHGVQRAAEESGFGNYAHFIRTFGRLVGVSPGRYARQRN